MSGWAVARHPGNGEHGGWSALLKKAEQHTLRLDELASGVGPDHDPSQDLITRLDQVFELLGDVLVLVDEVRHRIGQGAEGASQLAQPLDTLSSSIQTARDAIDDFKDTLAHELRQRADAERWRLHRPNRQFREDKQELRALARTAEGALTDVRQHMDDLLGWLTNR